MIVRQGQRVEADILQGVEHDRLRAAEIGAF